MTDKLVLWDIDGTLMFCGSNGTLALNKTFQDLYGIDDAFEKASIGKAMDAVILESIIENCRIPDPDRRLIIKAYGNNLKEILQSNEDKRVLPGIKELLDLIERHPSIYNGILTSNFRAGAMIKLESVHLDYYFKVGGFGDFYGEKWDAALIGVQEAELCFLKTFSPENVYIIGDSVYDIKCAHTLGMRSIGVATGWTGHDALFKEGPDHLFYDLQDYEKVFDILGSDA
jgi:phosphoglycolate phosphatase